MKPITQQQFIDINDKNKKEVDEIQNDLISMINDFIRRNHTSLYNGRKVILDFTEAYNYLDYSVNVGDFDRLSQQRLFRLAREYRDQNFYIRWEISKNNKLQEASIEFWN